ncbi:MAG: FAD-dependent oxidoreductase [Methanobacteriota archaeon]|nr:MAG: FAD-dependent oxidoreductase [Euryarchaeota archaeon]
MTGPGAITYQLPGRPASYWIESTGDSRYPRMPTDVNVDVAILGGGIVGITAAVLLKAAGLTVAMVEADRIARDVTGHTTAKITSLHRLCYHTLTGSFGRDGARRYGEANQAAIETIASVIASRGIACDFVRKPAYTYAEAGSTADAVKAEAAAARDLGLPASFVQDVPLPFTTAGAVRFDNQAQFHPRKYLCALARDIPGDGSAIYEETRAMQIKEGEPVVVETDRGPLKARDVIIATHFPFYDHPGLYFARMHPSRSYALGIRISEPFPEGMFINAEGPARSLRSQPTGGGELVIVGGDGHKTGQGGPTTLHYKHLEEFARSVFDVSSIDYRWSTQDNITVDGVPYIGRLTNDRHHVYVATGFGKWGMTGGTAAATILTDLILERRNPYAEVFDPSRFKPVASAKDFVLQNVNVAGELVSGYLVGRPKDPSALAPDDGAILDIQGKKVAAYRDGGGTLHLLDPACRHMGCVVTWNDAEKTWDCPCHGSRYSAEGRVIHGPAVRGLSKKK